LTFLIPKIILRCNRGLAAFVGSDEEYKLLAVVLPNADLLPQWLRYRSEAFKCSISY